MCESVPWLSSSSKARWSNFYTTYYSQRPLTEPPGSWEKHLSSLFPRFFPVTKIANHRLLAFPGRSQRLSVSPGEGGQLTLDTFSLSLLSLSTHPPPTASLHQSTKVRSGVERNVFLSTIVLLCLLLPHPPTPLWGLERLGS